ncbi:hypothetical protein DM02DRAFT_526037 [Periconia macrospinosa]|uniref:Xylanolytic transcriptional activator regulatory domain-containing protein n=1 Tax=Periconia macrospinosa TaxID=97972 RepID=A0A2V1DUM5_9PLEO|nr:hypothetical protein DM02DRAFT_526037 [Periconia macrospinosa]
MVFAVSATTKHRSGLTCQDPYGYFKAAEAYLGNIDLIGNVDAIQNLLLITRFGMYHHIGTSLWDISQLCMRQCIEWRLHLRRSVLLDPLTEQHYRRIFWACYVLDRHNSGILGRPFGILDTDIDVQLPADVDDETIVNSGVDSLDMIAPRTDSRPTELSVFIHCIKLRQISSRIHTDFYTGRSPSSHQSEYAGNTSSSKFKSIGHVYTSFSRFYSELKAWWSTNPTFSNPRSLYEKPEWHAFLYEKDLMLLARGALYNIPSRSYSFGGPVKEIFLTCYQAASRVIELYGDLMQKGAITWTRTYFQVIFTAGLSVIYCISQGVVKDMMNGREPVKTLTLCREILALFREKMPDAGSFTFVFEVLESECIRSKINVEEEAQYTESATTYNIINQGTGAEDGTSSLTDMAPQQDSTDVGNSHLNAYHMQPFDQESNDMTLNFTGNLDLMTQLQTGMDEYAWGWIPMDGNFWDQTTFY